MKDWYQHVENGEMSNSAKRIPEEVEGEIAHFAPFVERIQLLHVALAVLPDANLDAHRGKEEITATSDF